MRKMPKLRQKLEISHADVIHALCYCPYLWRVHIKQFLLKKKKKRERERERERKCFLFPGRKQTVRNNEVSIFIIEAGVRKSGV